MNSEEEDDDVLDEESALLLVFRPIFGVAAAFLTAMVVEVVCVRYLSDERMRARLRAAGVLSTFDYNISMLFPLLRGLPPHRQTFPPAKKLPKDLSTSAHNDGEVATTHLPSYLLLSNRLLTTDPYLMPY